MPRLNLTKLDIAHCPVTGKRQYFNHNDALLSQNMTSKITNRIYEIYKCSYCKKYHIGSWHYDKYDYISNAELKNYNIKKNGNLYIL